METPLLMYVGTFLIRTPTMLIISLINIMNGSKIIIGLIVSLMDATIFIL